MKIRGVWMWIPKWFSVRWRAIDLRSRICMMPAQNRSIAIISAAWVMLTDAEDLTAQTFLAVIESLGRYQHRDNFTAWIFQIARNKLMDHFRRNHAYGEINESVVDPAQGDVLDALVRDESRLRLKSLLHLLDEDERELIRLRYTAELSFVEIAQLLGRKEDAVRKAVRRILDRLSIQMEAQNV
ncbi:MAG: sigma-70 family RNA polymerase sigma factor [Anaerolineales bacterium]|uniref:RNA polymerase sigma factor n=1 Tax=Candidatus Villigracilis proximus TaxID=3140683 RepID=UPI003136DEA7|nr:sigma-70 family RNA polymerase sigma factor [Anaerolineales bacterium]